MFVRLAGRIAQPIEHPALGWMTTKEGVMTKTAKMGITKSHASASPRRSGFRAGSRSRQPMRIPDGKSFDLAELLEQQDKVYVRTVDGIGIDVERTKKTRIGGDHISGLKFTVRLLGVRVDGRYGSCQRYLTAWDSINPRRDSQRWRFAFDEMRGQIFHDGHVFVQFVI